MAVEKPMTTVLLFLLCITTIVSAYEGCQDKFSITDTTCSQFAFSSGGGATSNLLCYDMDKDMNTFYDLSSLPEVTWVDPRMVRIASMVTNVFENGDKIFGYAACQDIGDMRGFTCGYVGFTTGTNDANQVIREFSEIKPSNALLSHLGRLGELSQLNSCDITQRASTVGLESFCETWKQEACNEDQLFANFQKQWTLNNYLLPSARFAAGAGVTSALGQLIFYGNYTFLISIKEVTKPSINLVRILELTGARGDNESEQSYLTRFLTTRRQLQCCYPDNVWPLSATRSMDLQSLVDNFDTNQNLLAPVALPHFGQVVTGEEPDGIDARRCS
ncbi:lysozyme-like domain-containing protein [Phascolomyces articulosus]|uniref:Lysozyme-like domain-containing protein n=1 Tax=Phascolomyces articulosus TaxID=60185 RepID=A0AAD5K0M0_9FUNG|nr:lysozyme-like domain-containing protein [Phascolomyces articulosus]